MNVQRHYEDLVVIGSGAAGHHGGIQRAKLGNTAAAIERGPWLGGATINTGTIPGKTLREAVISAPNHGGNLAVRIEHVASNDSIVYANQFRHNPMGRQANTGSLKLSAADSRGRIHVNNRFQDQLTQYLRCRRCHQGAGLW